MNRALFSIVSIAVVTLTLTFAAGCKDSSPAAHDEEASGGHASADAVPGSHEDWCGEHAVPESQCTQCHKELIAAFKATGDWCDEHGLPKSHCKRCDPTLVIKRPAKAPAAASGAARAADTP